jgi:hypothetical protein
VPCYPKRLAGEREGAANRELVLFSGQRLVHGRRLLSFSSHLKALCASLVLHG